MQSCTLEGWTEIMINMQIRTNEYLWIFNFFIVFIGTFIITNLVMADLVINFFKA